MSYIGRFAPTPSGPLHQGSLVAAVGSYLRAQQQHGQWLLRIEDLDPPREQPGAADAILRTLEAHGLYWDKSVIYQSQQHPQYAAACEQLKNLELAYLCTCSRKRIRETGHKGEYGAVYSGHCQALKQTGRGTLRVRTHNKTIQFTDPRTGMFTQKIASEIGDFVIRRADGLYAYQLAVVVDDAQENITEVVRGEDLLDNTPRQIYLQQILGLSTPHYLHLPLVLNHQGQKLSKQNKALPVNNTTARENLILALEQLGYPSPPPIRNNFKTPDEILAWAIKHSIL